MLFNATFNSISVISWLSVLLVEETCSTWRNHRKSHWQTLCIEYTSQWVGFELTTLVVIGTDCTDSCKSNYHTKTTTTAPKYNIIIIIQTINTTDHRISYMYYLIYMYYDVSEWLMFSANSAISQLYHGENKFIFNEMMIVYCETYIELSCNTLID